MTPDSRAASDWLAEVSQALTRARLQGNVAEAIQSIALALDRLFRETGPGAAIDAWIDAFDTVTAAGYPALPSDIESRLIRAAQAILGRRPTHPALPLLASRAERLVDAPDVAVEDATRAAGYLFEFAIRGGNFALADRVVERTDVRLAAAPADPAVRVDWLEARALHAWLVADHDAAFDAVQRALAVAADAKLPEPYAAHEQGASAALSAQDLPRASFHLDAMRRLVLVTRAQDIAHLEFLRAARAVLADDLASARAQIDACLHVDDASAPLYFRTLWRLGRAHVAIAAGDQRVAGRELAEVLARASGLFWRYLEYSALLHRAWLRARQRRQEQAADDLARALAMRRTNGFRNVDPWWNPRMVQEVVALGDRSGLAAEVETFGGRLGERARVGEGA